MILKLNLRLSDFLLCHFCHTVRKGKNLKEERMSETTLKNTKRGLHHFYSTFSPASKAVILFVIPFTIIDAVHYYTAGSMLIVSFPLLAIIYLAIGMVSAKIAYQEGENIQNLPKVGRSAGLRLWLISTILNTIISIALGFASLGGTMVSGIFYLCLFAPFHAIGSMLVGGLGGWLYKNFVSRLSK